jgi:hypothetical protein
MIGSLQSMLELHKDSILGCANGSIECFRETLQTRQKEIIQSYLNKLFESLPNRKENNLTTAAITIFQQLPKDDYSSDSFNVTKNIILKNFDNLNPYDQSSLLENFWEKLKTPYLIPSLEKILSDVNPAQYLTNSTPLKRLSELDQKRAKPFIVKEICNPKSLVGFEVLGLLDDKLLPETDKCLLDQINEFKSGNRNSSYLQTKSLIAARYATASIYKDLMNIYKSSSDTWYKDSQAALLGYFARHNDKEAMGLIEKRLGEIKQNPISFFFYGLVKVNFTNGMEQILKKAYQNENLNEAGTAAYYLSQYGGKENREFIERRYLRWVNEWMSRRADFDNPILEKAMQKQKGFQVNVVSALKSAKSWKLNEAELNRLKETCFSKDCLRYFPEK